MAKKKRAKDDTSKAKAKVGAPTKKTQAKIDMICAALADGGSAKSACTRAGIGIRTLWAWLDGDVEFQRNTRARARTELATDRHISVEINRRRDAALKSGATVRNLRYMTEQLGMLRLTNYFGK